MVKEAEDFLHLALLMMGADLNSEGLKDTPKRIIKMWGELFKNTDIKFLDEQMTFFTNDSGEEPITMVMPFNSFCEHHLLPFFGKIEVTYIPSGKIVGLSKIPRIVEFFSKKPQLQERLGKEVGDYIFNTFGAKEVKIRIFDTTHTCVTCRGIEYEANTISSYKRNRIQEMNGGF